MAKNSSYKNILSSISDLQASDTVSVYVPSIGSEVTFNSLTVKQQKQLLQSSVDTEFENLSFLNTLNEIILENCTDKHVKILVTDKALIALQLRSNAMGSELTVTGDNDDKHQVDIDTHVKYVVSNNPGTTEVVSVEHGPIVIACRIPDLVTDLKYNKQFTKKVKNPNNTKLKVTDVIGDVYVSELVKFIKTVTVGEDVIDADDGVSVSNIVEIFENLPMQVSNKLADSIKDSREIERISLNPPELPEDVSISIDAGLFTTNE